MKELFLLRGLPGSGKSTLAKLLGKIHFEADMFFMKEGVYQFDITKLRDAHQWCQLTVEEYMMNSYEGLYKRIIVSNTFTMEWEMQPYFDLAEKHGYRVYSLIVENRHGGENVHNVPKEKIEEMARRFNVKIL